MKQIILDLLNAYGLVIFTIVAKFVTDYIKAHTRNAHILSATTYAEQVVNYIDKTLPDADNQTKKERAVAELTDRLNKNKLGLVFTNEEINHYIEFAVNKLHGGK